LIQEREAVQTEMKSLVKNIEHIKVIVSMQQNLAGMSGVVEEVDPKELMESAIQIECAAYMADFLWR